MKGAHLQTVELSNFSKNIYKAQVPTDANFKNFNEDEEATKIISISYLKQSFFKPYVVVPILSILTVGFFLLFLYWKPNLRRTFFYNPATKEDGSHVFIIGTTNH
mmetsp:Transcript_38182/g.36546  ORF Transcript_38182/g.36546 Transcript_38182/m.36546 type:complete len:105 (+) Transcript_38182:42-356(+)